MPEGGVAGVTQPNADWIKKNLDKRPFLLVLKQRNVQTRLVIARIRRTLPPRQDDEPA